MTTMRERRKEAAEQCRSMTDDELRALLALPQRRTTKTLRTVAEHMLSFRAHQRAVQEYRRESDRLRALTDDALWAEATGECAVAADGRRFNRAADEWQRRQRAAKNKQKRMIKEQQAERVAAARQQIQHLTVEQLLAFDPKAAVASHDEIRGVIDELRHRVRLCERKIKSLDRASWYAPHQTVVAAESVKTIEALALPGCKDAVA